MKIKFGIASMIILFSVVSKASPVNYQNNMSEIHGRVIDTRGAEQIREQRIFDHIERGGISGSNQYLEGIMRVDPYFDSNNKHNYDYDTDIKAFLMGTTSNFVNYPHIRVGVDYGYLKSMNKFKDPYHSKTKSRTHGLGISLAYDVNDWQIIAKSRYSVTMNRSHYGSDGYMKYYDRNYMVGTELGRYIDIGDNFGTLYPYIGARYDVFRTKSHAGIKKYNDGTPVGEIGFSYYKDFYKRVLLSGNISWDHEFSDRDKLSYNGKEYIKLEKEKNNGNFNLSIGYFTSPDFLITARYQAFFDTSYYYDLVGIGLSHNF